MNIVPMLPEHTEQLRAIYLAQVAHAPHCLFVPDHARFRNELLGVAPAGLYPAPRQSRIFVAEASGVARGFARLATYSDWDDVERQAITGLFFADEAAGHALVRACEAHAAKDELGAFPPGHGNTIPRTYNAGWDGLSDRIPGVAQVLSLHGYAPYFRELHLTQPLQPAQQRPWSLPPTITLHETPAERGTLRVQALEGDNEVGICYYCTLALLADDPAASQIGYILWLHVDEAHRRHGIARALMAAAMDQLVRQGCTACWLTTAADNWAAQSFYFALGFEVVDGSVSFRKLRRSLAGTL